MPAQSSPQPSRRQWWILGAVLLLTLMLVVVMATRAVVTRPGEPTAEPETPSTTEPRVFPTAPEPPFSVVDREPLTLPQSFRYAQGTFHLDAGSTYLVSFDLTTVKPEDAPGVGMYLGVSFSCTALGEDGEDDRGVGSIGGTENLLPGEPTSYVNHLVLTPQAGGLHSCSVLVNAPYDDVAAKGTTVELDVTWHVTELDGSAFQADVEQQLPMAIVPNAPATVVQQTIPAGELDAATLEVLLSLHVTTCTGINGSTENDRTWCTPEDVDQTGSDFDLTLRVDVLDVDGTVCDTLASSAQRVDLDKWRHHQLIPVSLPVEKPTELCGEQARVAAVVANRGPASLVVHQANTSLITVERD